MSLLLQLAFLLLLAYSIDASAKGLSGNATSLCTNGCDWSTPEIWDNGVVPVESDTVDIQISGTYKIVITAAITVADFEIGFSDSSHGTQTFQVTNGATFKSTGTSTTYLSVTLQVDAGSSFIISGQATVEGLFILYGFASYGGSNPSLHIGTHDGQITTNIVYGKLELHDGVVVVANKLTVSTASSLVGNGNINGTLEFDGTVKPGLSGVGYLNIYGDCNPSSSGSIYVDVASIISFDHVYISQTFFQDGSLYISPSGSYEPLAHSQFIVFNHTAQRNGFKTVRGTGLHLTNKWTAVVDQSYTAVLYDSASTVFVSIFAIAACLAVSIL